MNHAFVVQVKNIKNAVVLYKTKAKKKVTIISIVGKKDDGSYIDTPLRDIIIENVFK